MSLAIISPGRNPKVWIDALRHHQPDIDIQVYPEIHRPEDVEMALVWQHPPGYLNSFPSHDTFSHSGLASLNREATHLPPTLMKMV